MTVFRLGLGEALKYMAKAQDNIRRRERDLV
jgi:hypothetical protein